MPLIQTEAEKAREAFFKQPDYPDSPDVVSHHVPNSDAELLVVDRQARLASARQLARESDKRGANESLRRFLESLEEGVDQIAQDCRITNFLKLEHLLLSRFGSNQLERAAKGEQDLTLISSDHAKIRIVVKLTSDGHVSGIFSYQTTPDSMVPRLHSIGGLHSNDKFFQQPRTHMEIEQYFEKCVREFIAQRYPASGKNKW